MDVTGPGGRPETMIDAIARWARVQPAAPAFVAGDATLDFSRLAVEIDGMAAALLARGVRPAVPCGLVLESTPRHFLALLALFRLGVPVVPLALAEPAAERRGILARTGARLCIGLDAHATDGVPHLALDRLPAPGDTASLPPPPGLDAIAHFARSSGTSGGVPKMVATTFAQMASVDQRVAGRYPLGPGDRHLLLAPFAGFFGRQHARKALARGSAVVFPASVDTAAQLRGAVLRHGVTITALTPPMVRDLLAAGEPALVLPGVRLWVGTAALSADERRAVLARLTPQLYVGYGTSEVGGLTLADPDDIAADIETVGRPFAGIDAEAVDDDLRPVPVGTVGVMRYRSPAFATEYVDDVPGTASRFQDGWFYPGDAGSIDAAGRIRLVGRSDDFINVGGQKIHPSDIERSLTAHPAVAAASVLPQADARHGQVPVAAVVLRRPVEEDVLVAHCAGILLPRLRPRRVIAVDALPLNLAGKVDRLRLAAMVEAAIAGR